MKKLFQIITIPFLFITIVNIGTPSAYAVSQAKRALILKRCKRAPSSQLCQDPDKDKLNNWLERLYKTNPKKKDTDRDGLKDGLEVNKHHTNPKKPDTDGDGYTDGWEIRHKTNPLDARSPGNSNSCTVLPSPFDINNNTTSFQIPNGLTGNINRGKAFFTGHCSGCHAADKGTNFTYPELVAAVTGPKMGFSFPSSDFADLVAYLNRGNIPPTPLPDCALTPAATPTPGDGYDSTPTPLPTKTPTPPPGANCTPQPNPFDNYGNTTSFNIPNGLVGNITAGQTKFSSTCYGCHGGDRGTNYDYPALFAAVKGPPMYLTSLTDQEIANLVAYLNRTNIPPTPRPDCNPNITPTPSPTPTPLSDIARGELVYRAACSSCHTHPQELRDITVTKLNEAIREVNEMRSLQLSAEQKRVVVLYLRSL